MLTISLPPGHHTDSLMNEDAAPLGVDMINIRAIDTRASFKTEFIPLKHYSDINGAVRSSID